MNEKQTDGGSAFPTMEVPGSEFADAMSGMSLRDWFAGQALAGLASNGDSLRAIHKAGSDPSEVIARSAYDMADAMLAARAEQPS